MTRSSGNLGQGPLLLQRGKINLSEVASFLESSPLPRGCSLYFASCLLLPNRHLPGSQTHLRLQPLTLGGP